MLIRLISPSTIIIIMISSVDNAIDIRDRARAMATARARARVMARTRSLVRATARMAMAMARAMDKPRLAFFSFPLPHHSHVYCPYSS